MAVWPTSLPQSPEVDGFDWSDEVDTITNSMSVGPPKTRPRTTKARYVYTCPFILDDTQRTTLRDFVENTLGNGADSFEFPDPFDSNTTLNVKIQREGGQNYQLTALGGTLYQATLTVRTV